MRLVSKLFLSALFSFVLLSSITASAASTNPKESPSGNYVLDTSHASITFRILHLGFSYYTGRFDKFTANLHFDSISPEKSSLEVKIDPNSISTNNATLEGELRGDKYFNVTKFPEWSFLSKKIEVTGPNTGKVTGDFTMMGVTQPVTLDVIFVGGGMHPMMKTPTIGFTATGTLQRSHYLLNTGIPFVGDDVKFQIEAEFNSAPTSTPPAPAAVQ